MCLVPQQCPGRIPLAARARATESVLVWLPSPAQPCLLFAVLVDRVLHAGERLTCTTTRRKAPWSSTLATQSTRGSLVHATVCAVGCFVEASGVPTLPAYTHTHWCLVYHLLNYARLRCGCVAKHVVPMCQCAGVNILQMNTAGTLATAKCCVMPTATQSIHVCGVFVILFLALGRCMNAVLLLVVGARRSPPCNERARGARDSTSTEVFSEHGCARSRGCVPGSVCIHAMLPVGIHAMSPVQERALSHNAASLTCGRSQCRRGVCHGSSRQTR